MADSDWRHTDLWELDVLFCRFILFPIFRARTLPGSPATTVRNKAFFKKLEINGQYLPQMCFRIVLSFYSMPGILSKTARRGFSASMEGQCLSCSSTAQSGSSVHPNCLGVSQHSVNQRSSQWHWFVCSGPYRITLTLPFRSR